MHRTLLHRGLQTAYFAVMASQGETTPLQPREDKPARVDGVTIGLFVAMSVVAVLLIVFIVVNVLVVHYAAQRIRPPMPPPSVAVSSSTRATSNGMKDALHAPTPEAFNRLIKQRAEGIVVLFSSSHCPACQQLLPVLDALLVEMGTHLPVVHITQGDAGADDIANALRIAFLPTLVLFRSGKEVERCDELEVERMRRMLTAAVAPTPSET